MFKPLEDGKTHVNIYTKGRTELGRALSNLSNYGFSVGETRFSCMEGWWYWSKFLLSVKHDVSKLPVDCFKLPSCNGFQAKALGKTLKKEFKELGIELVENDDPVFQEFIRIGLNNRFKENPDLWCIMKASTLPFAHYYFYGEAEKDPKVVDLTDSYGWLIKLIEYHRNYL